MRAMRVNVSSKASILIVDVGMRDGKW
jgi:hypothetical protein